MNEESKDIKIPIKAIVDQSMHQNGAKYEEDEFNLLRKYFIACLNLGYMEPKDLVPMVNKFSEKIKLIVLNYNNVNKMDYYMINTGVLYISGALKDNNPVFYEINFYKAVTEVVFNANDTHIGLSNALCEMVSEKIHNMDANGSRIIMPRTDNETVGDKQIQIRAGYMNYNLIISLVKQLFINKNLNENKVIRDMYFEGYDAVINRCFSGNTERLLLDVIDKLCIMYINRRVRNMPNPSEMDLLNKYQVLLNDSFTKMDQNYLAFCALITTDELREKCMNKFRNNAG
ncbi:MAG: hypothetical protein U0M66_04505 [Bacilli bacterium]|nr:hypothetical protein [Bacilli bacterium]